MHTENTARKLYKISLFTLISGLALLFYVISLIIFPLNSIKYLNIPFPVNQTTYQPNELIEYVVEYCRTNNKPVEVVSELVSSDQGVYVPLGRIESNFGKGCNTVTVKRYIIPEYTPEGEYFIQSTVTARNNFLNHDTYVITTDTFIISNIKENE